MKNVQHKHVAYQGRGSLMGVSIPRAMYSTKHVLSKRIVQNAQPGATIVVENVSHIRKRAHLRKGEGQRRLHSWSFDQFHAFLSYKAQARGMQVVKVDPRHTSQTCSRCGYQARTNRRSQSLFHCRSCGYQLNADYNASRTIREKHLVSLASLGTSLTSGLPATEPLVSTLRSQEQAPGF